MVKAGAKRAAKFALKFDAYVNMIRSKHEHFLIKRLFMETTYKQAFLDRSVQDIAAKCSIGWGSKANLEKYAELYLWKGQGTLADFLAAGLNLCAYNEVVQLPAKLLSLFYVCTYPRSQAKSTLSIAPLPNQVPLTSRADWLAQLTAGSEQEANLLLAIPNKLSILNAQVCAHNVANNLALFLNAPSVTYMTLSISSKLINPLVQLTDVGLLSQHINSLATVDIKMINPPFLNLYVEWLQWGKKPILHITVATPNVYNLNHALSVSVVKTP